MRLISSNIRFANDQDGKNRWEYRKDLLSKVLSDFSPDIIATQEGRREQIEELKALLPSFSLANEKRPWISERMYPNLLINSQTVSLKECGDFWLSTTPDIAGSVSFESSFPRLATWLKGEMLSTKEQFFYINTHLDHILPSTRAKQIEVLISQVNLLNHEKLPLILCGDFNEGPKGEVRRLIHAAWPNTYDPWIELDKEEEISHHGFGKPSSHATRIDWFILDKAFKCQNIFFDKTANEGIYPSDHYPLKIEIFSAQGIPNSKRTSVS